METPGKPHDLAVETIEAVMAPGLARIALLYAAADPSHTRPPGGPFDEGVDTCRLGVPAIVLLVMDDQRARQRGR